MAEFVWEARARTGELRKGTMEAEDEATVNARLRQQQLSPVKVKKKAAALKFQLGQWRFRQGSRHLHPAVRDDDRRGSAAGAVLGDPGGQQPNKIFAGVLKDVKNSVEQGASFSDSLRRHPKVFDELFVNLVHAGEVGGILDTIMSRLSVYLEKRQKLVRQVRGALVYPSIVIVIAVGVMTVLLTFVIPAFERMFQDFGGGKDALPKLTQMIVALSHGFVTYLPFIAVAASSRPWPSSTPIEHPAVNASSIKTQLRLAAARAGAAQDRRGALHAHAGNAAAVGRSDSWTPSRSARVPAAT